MRELRGVRLLMPFVAHFVSAARASFTEGTTPTDGGRGSGGVLATLFRRSEDIAISAPATLMKPALPSAMRVYRRLRWYVF